MSSTVQACRHLSSSVNFILITCLPPLLPLVFTVVVILPLLSRSCLYSQHNWMKCCCLDGTGTSIVSHQSLLKMTLLCQMTFHLWKERKEKKKRHGALEKGMNYPNFKATEPAWKWSQNIHVGAPVCVFIFVCIILMHFLLQCVLLYLTDWTCSRPFKH